MQVDSPVLLVDGGLELPLAGLDRSHGLEGVTGGTLLEAHGGHDGPGAAAQAVDHGAVVKRFARLVQGVLDKAKAAAGSVGWRRIHGDGHLAQTVMSTTVWINEQLS